MANRAQHWQWRDSLQSSTLSIAAAQGQPMETIMTYTWTDAVKRLMRLREGSWTTSYGDYPRPLKNDK